MVVLDYRATWCVPCRAELPLPDRYYDLQKGAGLRVFAIAAGGLVPLHRLRARFAAMKIPAVGRLSGGYGALDAVPTNYIIDRAGRIRHAKAGALDLDDLNGRFVPLLREPAP